MSSHNVYFPGEATKIFISMSLLSTAMTVDQGPVVANAKATRIFFFQQIY